MRTFQLFSSLCNVNCDEAIVPVRHNVLSSGSCDDLVQVPPEGGIYMSIVWSIVLYFPREGPDDFRVDHAGMCLYGKEAISRSRTGDPFYNYC